MKYYQLQTISCFSFFSSSVKLEDYCIKLISQGYSGGSICDNFSLAAFPYLYSAFKGKNIKDIYGIGVDIENDDLIYKGQLIVLNEEGYLNLVQLVNKHLNVIKLEDLSEVSGLAFILKTEDRMMKDKEFLESHNNFFLALSRIFKNFYFGIEIYSKEDSVLIQHTRDFIASHSYDSVAFPKVQYLDSADSYKTFCLLSAIGTKTVVQEKDLITSGPYFLISTKVKDKIYLLTEIAEEEKIVSAISFEFMKNRGSIIQYSSSSKEDLYQAALSGLNKRFSSSIEAKYLHQLNYELSIIDSMGFNDYFLIVADYINFAKKNKIKVGPGRGSAAGSLVSYSLGITDINPIKFNLTFERFLNPLRKTMPDIDVDFEDDKREEVVNYLRTKYGDSRVSAIVTYQTLQMRSAIKNIGMIFNVPEDRISTLSKAISFKGKNFKEELTNNKFLIKLYKDEYYKKIIDLSKLVFDYPVNTSMHAAGVILSNERLDRYIPLTTSPSAISVAGYEYQTLEQMGFLKMDILALSNLSFISKIENNIISNGKKLPNIIANLNDAKSFNVIDELLLVDLFQLESSGMRNTIRLIKPNSIIGLADLIALYRPGPMKNIASYARRKNGQEKYSYSSPIINELLKETYGIIIYQEQIMSIARKVAIFDGGKADLLRQAISKKKYEQMEQLKKEFINGAVKNKYSLEEAEKIYSLILEFASYGFNKAHAVSYAFLTYTLAYYKANYPEEFYLASLNKISLSDDKFIKIKQELSRFAFGLHALSINKSSDFFSFHDNYFYVGFNSVKNVNPNFVSRILEERKKGDYVSLFDFLSRISLNEDDKRSLTNLIFSGAFDEFNISRKDMIDKLDTILLSTRFASSSSSMPLIDKKGKPTLQDFENEFFMIGKVFSFSLEDVITSKKKYRKLYVVVSSPLYYAGEMKVELLDENKRNFVYLPSSFVIKKEDIISVEEEYDYLKKRVIINKVNKESY